MGIGSDVSDGTNLSGRTGQTTPRKLWHYEDLHKHTHKHPRGYRIICKPNLSITWKHQIHLPFGQLLYFEPLNFA
jgi:hypothetical protein